MNKTLEKQNRIRDKFKIRQNAQMVIDAAELIDSFATAEDARNSQWFINWQDKLNEISVR